MAGDVIAKSYLLSQQQIAPPRSNNYRGINHNETKNLPQIVLGRGSSQVPDFNEDH